MTSFRLSLTPSKRAAGRFISKVRRELQKALSEEHARRGLTQSDLARKIGVHRSVIHRQLVGIENLTLGRVGELAAALGREADFALRDPAHRPGSNIITPVVATSEVVATSDILPLRFVVPMQAAIAE